MSFSSIIAACLERKERVEVHFWWDGQARCWQLRTLAPLPPERDIFLVTSTPRDADTVRYLDPARLFRLPRLVAEELLGNFGEPCDRDTFELHDSLTRALKSPPAHFGRDAYTDRRPWWDNPKLERQRAAHVARNLADVDDTPHELPARGPWCSDYGATRGNLEQQRALYAQVGVHVDNDNDGRTTVERVGAEWKRALLELEHAPTWLNGVPVRREACAGNWFQVGTCEDPPDVHFQRLGLGDAVQRVRSGHFPRLPNAPPPWVTCVGCGTAKQDRWRGAFAWCLVCVARVCLDCHNDHFDSHAREAAV